MTTNPKPQPPPNSRRRTINPEQKKQLREAWEEHWATPIPQPVDLNWALEIRSNGSLPVFGDNHVDDGADNDPESAG